MRYLENASSELKLFNDKEFINKVTTQVNRELKAAFASLSKTQQRKKSNQNIHISAGMKLVGENELPEVAAYTGDIPLVLTPYSMKDTGNKNGAVHFYIDDYRFDGMYTFRHINHYTKNVALYKTVIAPDFSLYLDQSCTLNKFQLYKNRVVTAYWQSLGMQVIPSVSWGNAESFKYCFEGLPQNSVLSIGGLGNSHHPSMIKLWEYGVRLTIERLHPIALIIYGAPKKLDLPVKTYYFEDFINTKLK